MGLHFESIKIAHNLPEINLTTWTFHEPIGTDSQKRKTYVAILTEDGDFAVGTRNWLSKLKPGQSPKKDAFNRAYGRACQKLTAALRAGLHNKLEYETMTPPEISKWVRENVVG